MKHKRFNESGDNFDEINDVSEPTKKWFEEIPGDPPNSTPVTEGELINLKEEARKCLEMVISNKFRNKKNGSNTQWIKTAMSKGTALDKIAAHTLAIQDDPLSNLESLRNFVGMVKVGKKKECRSVMETLTELFLTDLLRPDRKLKAFHQRPLSLLNEMSSGNAITRRKILSTWYFEDQLKEIYTTFVLALNNVSHDTVENTKEKAITAMYKLLVGNPEQEKNLLSNLINKLGDPSQKVASKAIYTLSQVLMKHPNMQGVVLNEVEKLLFRPNVSSRAQYYGVCFLTQYYLSNDNNEIAKRLIEIYFAFFRACVKKGEIQSRMMSALLMGVNRAYPFSKMEMDKISGHIDTVYRIVHLSSFNISIHALTLLYQVSFFSNNITDRFYSALYKKLADPKLLSTTYQAMLLSLIYKALLKDPEPKRIKTFIKRLLQLALLMQPPFACGVLFLISQLMGKRQDIQSLILEKSNIVIDEDDDEEETYYDVKDEELEGMKKVEKENEEEIKPDVDTKDSSWYHVNNLKTKKIRQEFNPSARNPLYAGSEFTAYVELLELKNHFHPTVALYASNILNGILIKYMGDPLKDFTLIRFLDRFVFKNPKKVEEKDGVHPVFGKRKYYRPQGVKSIPINSAEYLNEKRENIPVDELFMYIFLQKKNAAKPITIREDDEEESDTDSVKSEEFEEMLDKMYNIKDDEVDYMNDIGNSLKEAGTKKKNVVEGEDDELSEDEQISDEDEDEDFDDESLEMNDEDRELLSDLEDDDDDEEEMLFDEDSEDEQPKKKRKADKNDIRSLYASADEFSAMLEDEGSSKVAPGTSSAFANKDKADLKQIEWESKRNRWVKGYKGAMGKGKKKFQSKGKTFNKKTNKNRNK